MTNITKMSAIAIAVISAAYALTMLDKDEPQQATAKVQTGTSQNSKEKILAPVSRMPVVNVAQQRAPQPADILKTAAKHSIANQSVNQAEQNDNEPRAELTKINRLAPPPPLAPGELASSRHNNSANNNDRGHGHDHPKTTVNYDSNQPAPPAGANI